MTRVLVIAEAGVNHNGDIAVALALVDAAHAAGADIVKFQTFSAERLVTTSGLKASYQVSAGQPNETQFEMLKRLELSLEDHHRIVGHCRDLGIEFLSTGFDIESIDLLLALGVDLVKVPSGELTNLPMLRHIGALNYRTIISTGMADMSEVQAGIAVLEDAGLQKSDLTVLHCTTEYPTAMGDVNLRAMSAMRDLLGVQVGYSDHTLGIEVPIAAVALGAAVIEKHFTLDRTMKGPDHRASLQPSELRDMVTSIRNIEMAFGSPVKTPTSSEIAMRAVARKSIVARVPIQSGAVLSSENITVKRPGTGISPMAWDDVIGTLAVRDFDTDEMLEL